MFSKNAHLLQIPNKVVSIQILRGLAAFILMFGHILGKVKHEYAAEEFSEIYANIYKISGLGADIFFVLTGMLMVLVTQDIGTKRAKVKHFIQKRLIRVYPIYWFAFLIFICLRMLEYKANGQEMFFDVDIGSLFSSFLLLPTEINSSYYPFLGIAWILIFEIFFYLIYSLFLFQKISHRILSLSLTFSFLVLIGIFIANKNVVLAYSTSPIIFEFLLGCVIGYLYKRKLLIRQRYAFFFLLISILILAFSSQFGTPYIRFDNLNAWRLLVWGIPSAFLVYSLLAFENRMKSLSLKSFIQLGNASFSLYLFHAAAFLPIAGYLFSKFGVYEQINIHLMIMILSVFCIIGAQIIYLNIELPMVSKLKRRIFYNENFVSSQNRV